MKKKTWHAVRRSWMQELVGQKIWKNMAIFYLFGICCIGSRFFYNFSFLPFPSSFSHELSKEPVDRIKLLNIQTPQCDFHHITRYGVVYSTSSLYSHHERENSVSTTNKTGERDRERFGRHSNIAEYKTQRDD